MPQYLLQAGNTPMLSFYEAQAVAGSSLQKITDTVLSFTADSDEEAKKLFEVLGASVRLVKLSRDWRAYSEAKMQQALFELLSEEKTAKIHFSIAQWGDRDTARISKQTVKEALADKGIKSRFIEGGREGLSAAVLLHQEVVELVVLQEGKKILLGKTLAVQDIDHWTLKDRGKPYFNRKKGMLPPKVARAMVNLALGAEGAAGTLVYDPFCGTGTILIEALERGARTVGSDLDKEAALGAQTNLAWFADRIHSSTRFEVFRSDVSQVTLSQLPGKVDCIVTEPFLGKPQPETTELAGMFRGLEKLYLGAFNQWSELLRDGGKVVMIFPRVEVQNGPTYDCSGFVDKLQARGYTLQVDFGKIRYYRPQAIVQRDIVVFQYNTH